MASKTVVLLSGGMDSAVTLHLAQRDSNEVVGLSFRYGQRHADAELAAAADIAAWAGVPREELDLTTTVRLMAGSSALLDPSKELTATGGFADGSAPDGLPTSYVLMRNPLFLTVAFALAVRIGADEVHYGAQLSDHAGYPDCRPEFVSSFRAMAKEALPSGSCPVLLAPLAGMTKTGVLGMAQAMGEDCLRAVRRSVSCYRGEVPGCGQCPSCEQRTRAFRALGL